MIRVLRVSTVDDDDDEFCTLRFEDGLSMIIRVWGRVPFRRLAGVIFMDESRDARDQ